MLPRIVLLAALAASVSASLVLRHEETDCSAAASSTTRKCTQRAGQCCPRDWSCVTTSDGSESCVANARGSSCPTGYGPQGGVCILGATPDQTGTGGPSGSPSGQPATTTAGGGSDTSEPTGTTSNFELQTTLVEITSASVSTSVTYSTSGSETIPITVPVTVPVVATIPVEYSILPSESGTLVVLETTATSYTTSYTVSGSETVPVTIPVPVPTQYSLIVDDGTTSLLVPGGTGSDSVSISTSFSTSGSVTVPVTVSVTPSTTASDGSTGTQTPDSAYVKSSSLVAVVAAAALAVFGL